MIRKVGIVGLGALGVMYSHRFQEKLGRENVYVLAGKDRIARYRNEGVYANGALCDFQYIAPEEAPVLDLLIFTTKFYGLREAAESAIRACGENTIVMSFLNGVTSEQVVAELLRPARLLYTTVQGMDATKTGNQVMYTKLGSVAFGEKDNRRSEAVEEVADFLERVGITGVVAEDITHQQWSKWMLNVGVNQTCAVYALDYSGVQHSGEYRDAMIAAMEEARLVANAEGIALTEQEKMDWVALMDTLAPNGEASMRQDTRAGRQTEVDLFAGAVCALGKKHGIPTPLNDKFYAALS